MFKTIIGIERAQQQHRAMTASPRSSLLSATGNGWVPDMQVFRLIPGAAAASARDLPQLGSSPRRSHVACPTSRQRCQHLPAPKGPKAAPPRPACSTWSPQPPAPLGQAVTRDVGAQTTPHSPPSTAMACVWGRHTRWAPGEEAAAVWPWAGAGSQPQAGSGTCLPEARVCSPAGLLCKSPHAGVRCPPSRQPQERAVAREPPSRPRGASGAGRGPEAGGRDRPGCAGGSRRG